ncbi:MAG: hypothetical protein CMQ34_02990 [Gammaproteobacteria bacterium]|nr:hypothetical protein [Gammaproteobacteria bacterium]|tara:strand:- start:3020 stop:3673 length:654 start_codon:yes stop_codon:yes gene_type:complete
MKDLTRSKLKLAFLLLITFVPITMATFAFRTATESGGFGSGTVNKGNFILPPADITDLGMSDATGAPMFTSFEDLVATLESEEDYVAQPWLMIFVNAGTCDAACEERVFYLRQLHITLGKNIERVRRYYLHADAAPIAAQTASHFREQYPSMGIAYSSAQQLQQSLAAKGVDLDLTAEDYVFFVDPVGNVMMYYDGSHTIEDIKTDLDRLLRHSSLG